MYGWFYKGSDLLSLPIVSLILFMAVFVAVVVRTWFLRDPDSTTLSMSQLPLNDESTPDNGARHG